MYLAWFVVATLGVFAEPGQAPVESQIIVLEPVLTVPPTSVAIVLCGNQQPVASPVVSARRQERRVGEITRSVVQLEVREVLQASQIATPRLEGTVARLISEIDGSASPGQSRAVKPLAPPVTNAVPQVRLRPETA